MSEARKRVQGHVWVGDLMIVGQAPSRGGDPAKPLMSEPIRSNLEGLLGVGPVTFDLYVGKVNLLMTYPGPSYGRKGDAFNSREARVRAGLLRPRLVAWKHVLFLGARTAAAFGFRDPDAIRLTWRTTDLLPGVACAMLPHPSGVNLWWNDSSNRRRATRFMRALGRKL